MKPITIVLTGGYSDWEIAALGGAGRAFYGADIRFVSPDGGNLTSAAGLSVANTAKFQAPFEGIVVVCGSPVFEDGAPADISARLLQAQKAGCIIAAICGGTIALARTGILNDVKHTSNRPGYLEEHAAGYAGSETMSISPRRYALATSSPLRLLPRQALPPRCSRRQVSILRRLPS